jgi:hypothetical protein
MRMRPNWETMAPEDHVETPDRLRIPRDQIPEGMDLQWVTDSIFGQPQAQSRAEFEKKGWTPVYQEDFGGIYDGRFMPKGKDGEINVDGTVLMARPLELSLKAKQKDRRAALEQVAVKEQALRGGDIGTSLDTNHPSAVRLNSNGIKKSFERLTIPEE